MDQKIINLFDEYTHKSLSRKEFISRLAKLTGSVTAAMAVLPLLEVNYAQASVIGEDDPDLEIKDITYPGEGINMKAYQAKPRKNGKLGTVVVIHENRGLNPHIKDVTRRVAKAGFIALAPDALSEFGGTPTNEDEARDLIGKLDSKKNLNNFLKAYEYLGALTDSNKKTGVVGFCWGGAMANQLAVNNPDLDVAVPFYGKQPSSAEVSKIKAQIQLHYGELDERVNAGISDYEKALKESGTKYELFIYKGAQHAFHNDTAPTRYNAESAKLAWERTIALFDKALK